jgi:glycosyltransferase involved in cell wall biosynthesis
MTRVLLLTNDFPPRRGGIQSYLEAFVGELQSAGGHELTVYAPKWKGCTEYDAAAGYRVVRHPTTLMLPEPTVADRMRELIVEHGIETVWFGAAAPLALLGPLARRAGATRIVASTHGHEVGWSMLPLARSALRRIGEDADVVTYVSDYTRGRFSSAFGPRLVWSVSRRASTSTGSPPTRWPGPAAGPLRAGGSAVVLCLCGWCRARARTCSSAPSPRSGSGARRRVDDRRQRALPRGSGKAGEGHRGRRGRVVHRRGAR